MSSNQRVVKGDTQSSLWDVMPKMMFAITAAVMVPVIVFIVLLLLIFGILLITGFSSETPIFVVSAASYSILVVLFLGFAAFFVAGFQVGLLGFPASIIGWHLGLIRWWSSVIVGFFLGCLPIALLMFPRKGSSSSVQGVPLMIDGVFTSAGWLDYAEKILFMGFFGAVGGFSFWLIWRYWERITRVRENYAIH